MSRMAGLLLDEWQKNMRFRLGLWLILAILAVYLLIRISDLEQAMLVDYRMEAARIDELSSLCRQKVWIERAEAARALKTRMESKLWRAETRGLAQARTRSWISTLLMENGATNARIEVESPRDTPGLEGIRQVEVRVETGFDFSNLPNLLKSLENPGRLTSMEQLDVINGSRPRITLVFKAYFLVP